jgi:uncharacterized transporter YbjL
MNTENLFEGVGIIGTLFLFLIVTLIIIFGTGYMFGGTQKGQEWAGKFVGWLLTSTRKIVAWSLRQLADWIAPAKKKKKP